MRGYRHPSRGGGLRAASRVYIRLSEGWQCKKQGGGPCPHKTRDHPMINSFQGPPPGTTPSKINKYHNFNKLQGQGPPPETTPKFIRDHPPGTTPLISKIRGGPWLAKTRDHPPDNFISGTTPGTTPSKINKYHNFNKLQGQGPPQKPPPKYQRLGGGPWLAKTRDHPFDNFYIRDHPPGTTPKYQRLGGGPWLAKTRDHPPDNFISGTTPRDHPF